VNRDGSFYSSGLTIPPDDGPAPRPAPRGFLRWFLDLFRRPSYQLTDAEWSGILADHGHDPAAVSVEVRRIQEANADGWVRYVDEARAKGGPIPVLPEPHHSRVEKVRPRYWERPDARRPPRAPGVAVPPPVPGGVAVGRPALPPAPSSLARSQADAEILARFVYELWDEWHGDVSALSMTKAVQDAVTAAERVLNVQGRPLLTRPVIPGEYREREEAPVPEPMTAPISLRDGIMLDGDDAAYRDIFLWVRSEYRRLNFSIFETGNFNLNVGGIRVLPGTVDAFGDLAFVMWRENGVWRFRCWPSTTRPGKSVLLSPSNPAGAGSVAVGQWRGVHVIGDHKDAYTALVQLDRDVGVRRDKDRDAVHDAPSNVIMGRYGFNVHAADKDPWDKEDRVSTVVGGWSEMCHVFASSADFREFMSLIFRAASVWGPRFSHTILEAKAAEIPNPVPRASRRLDYSAA
jgi:hypothetical protein